MGCLNTISWSVDKVAFSLTDATLNIPSPTVPISQPTVSQLLGAPVYDQCFPNPETPAKTLKLPLS